MRIAGLQKLTLLDFPSKMAATVFAPGCNLRCPFCHNAPLVVPGREGFPALDAEEVRAFLKRRRGVLDGVCITGGEPLLQPDIAEFCAGLKAMGFAVKLDTNGGFPATLALLIERRLVDYVAMDAKAAFVGENGEGGERDSGGAQRRFARVAGVDVRHARSISAAMAESAALLIGGGIAHEFRTTVVRELHDAAHLRAIAETLRGAQAWYLQGFVDSGDVVGGAGRFHAYAPDEMRALADFVRGIVPAVQVRGVD